MDIRKESFESARICSKERTRYALTGVQVRRESGVETVTASDGKSLISFREKGGGEDFSAIVEGKSFGKVGKGLKKGESAQLDETNINGAVKLAAVTGTVKIVAGSSTVDVPVVGGNFPDWEACVPKPTKSDSVSVFLSPARLRDLADILTKATDRDSTAVVKFTVHKSELRAILIETVAKYHEEGPAVTAVLMPMTVAE